MKVTLYSYWRSSSSHRVRIALGFKGIPFETVGVNLLGGEQASDEHKTRAPNGYVPALTIDGDTYVESVAIIELLDDLFDALGLGVADYLKKTGAFQSIGIALSGGRDSLLTLLVACLERPVSATNRYGISQRHQAYTRISPSR